MKKLLIAFAAAVVISLICFAVNYISYRATTHIPLAVRHDGGEVTVEIGFGWQCVHTYAMTPNDHDSRSIRFEPFSLIFSVLILTAVIFILLLAGTAIFRKKN